MKQPRGTSRAGFGVYGLLLAEGGGDGRSCLLLHCLPDVTLSPGSLEMGEPQLRLFLLHRKGICSSLGDGVVKEVLPFEPLAPQNS